VESGCCDDFSACPSKSATSAAAQLHLMIGRDHVGSDDKFMEKDELSGSTPADEVRGGRGGSDGGEPEEMETETPSEGPPGRPPPPPNGGYGWVCTACCALINGHTWGLNSSYGVFLAYYLATDYFPGATSLDYAFVGSLSISCAMLISPLATYCVRVLGTRTTLFIGVAFETASLIGASFARVIWQLYLSQGVCFGLGMGFLFVASVGIVPQWFTTKRSLANGFATCGSGLGGLVYSFATGAMLKSIGLAWAFRVLGIVACAVNSICAMLLRDRNKLIGARPLAFDVQLFRRPEYLLL